MKEKKTVQSVERTLRILECYKLEKSELELGEIARMTLLSKATVYRLLHTMAQNGYIKQDPNTQKYSLGFKFFHLGAIVAGDISLRKAALPFMKQLCDEISETVNLNIVHGNQRVCIEMVESPEVIRNIVKVGERNHLCFGASGRVMLSYLPEDERQRIVAEAEQEKIISPDEAHLKEEIKAIQEKGYTISIDRRIQGTFSIAAPIFDHHGDLVGSITAAGPTQRITETRIPLLIERVMYTAHKISESMGFPESRNSEKTKDASQY